MDPHRELRSLLARIRLRWFALIGLRSAGQAAAAAALPLLGAAVAAWQLALAGWWLVALIGIALAAAAAAVLLVWRRVPPRPDDCRVARFIEEQTGASDVTPVLCDALVSAVQVTESPGAHGAFETLVVGRAVGALREIAPAAVVTTTALRRAGVVAATGGLLLAAAVVAVAPHLLRAGATVWVAWFPATIHIEVLTGDVRVPAGQPLRIAAVVRGRGVSMLAIAPSLVVAADGQQRSVPMTPSGEGFGYAFESVDRSFQYQVAAGAASSRSYSVTALLPPRVTRIDVTYEYPRFTGLQRRDELDGGDIYGPAGTRVRLLIHSDKPLSGGELALAGSIPVALTPSPGATAAADLVLARDGAYRVKLADFDGLRSVDDVEYFIRVMDDRPPDVRIVRPASDQSITPLQEVAIEARADDDYGIAQFDLVYTVAGRVPQTVPFSRVTGTSVARAGSQMLAVEDLRVRPGDVITYYARARDIARGKRSSETRSDMYFLEVKPFTEEFVSAQSQSMGGGAAAAQIDSLIAGQKDIITATWNLERRSEAGRSSGDMKAVSAAQAELKGRAEQMLGVGRRRGRGFFPQQIAPPSPESRGAARADPIGEAVAAMGRAAEQLNVARTAAAIPHEMAALQGLLQAQAEVRRRQVMLQSASGAGQGGSNRSDRDLSALFDRELQRQQRTNYETAPQSADTTARTDTDAVDRLRDLARRQEDLSRRQRELGEASLAAAERKRQLERLTREQEELREQAEALEKEMQGSAAGRGSRASAGGAAQEQGSASLQRAAERMREAAAEMQRQNAGRAAATGAQAAATLRQLEAQMRGSTADARQRTAGELQLEAQQIAEGQRRIAAEVARLDKEHQGAGRATGDARRRLAAEKDKLAERVDELQRAAQAADRSAPGPAGTPFREAARQLQTERIGSRMRESAQQLRDRSGAPRQEQAGSPSALSHEQQLARALESVVETLGGGRDHASPLSAQLDRTREMRDRLNRAEQQLRESEAQARSGRDAAARAPSSPADDRGGSAGRSGSAPQRGGNGPSGAGQQVQRAREEYARELQRSRETLGRMQAEQQRGAGGATPEQHEFSRSAPGNESFKQDFGKWESLRRDIDLALEKYEAAVSARLARPVAGARLTGGGSERVPDLYRPLVSRYFEAIAKVKQ